MSNKCDMTVTLDTTEVGYLMGELVDARDGYIDCMKGDDLKLRAYSKRMLEMCNSVLHKLGVEFVEENINNR